MLCKYSGYVSENRQVERHQCCPLEPCGSLRVAMSHQFVEILDFTQFFDHFVFTPNEQNILVKELKKEISVSVGVELVGVDMSENLEYMG